MKICLSLDANITVVKIALVSKYFTLIASDNFFPKGKKISNVVKRLSSADYCT